MSFGFRRRPASGIPMPVTNGVAAGSLTSSDFLQPHPRSKSAGHEIERPRRDEESYNRGQSSASGRSTPRLAPPKKEAAAVNAGLSLRTNRFGFRQPQSARFTDRVGDLCASHNASNNYDKSVDKFTNGRRGYGTNANLAKPRPSPVAGVGSLNNNPIGQEPISKYTLHTSHLPQPQFAVRMQNEANFSKNAKTAANQSRKISTASKFTNSSSKEGSGTEDSGLGSQLGCLADDSLSRGVDFLDVTPMIERRGTAAGGRPRNLRMVVNGKSFDVRDVRDDDTTVTEISVIALPKSFQANVNINTGLVRERTSHYQRAINKDNRFNNDSVSVTSSEGYDEGLGEEKAFKDRSRFEKPASVKSDFSPPSSDDPEYGHGEAMADEYSFSSSDECRGTKYEPKSVALRSVLLTIEDPAFAAAAATTTTLIDDETSPVDSLFDSPTASITQSDGKTSRKENLMEKSGNTVEDDSPGTPTNASNSLSLSEGREFFDDEIADQPGLTFDETIGHVNEILQTSGNQQTNENSYTLVESHPKTGKHF